MSRFEPLPLTLPTPHMGPTLPTVLVLPSVSSQPIDQASLTAPAQNNLPVMRTVSASHTETLPPSEAAEQIAPTLPSVSASPICVLANLPTVPALPTGPKLPTAPSPAIDSALPGVFAYQSGLSSSKITRFIQ